MNTLDPKVSTSIMIGFFFITACLTVDAAYIALVIIYSAIAAVALSIIYVAKSVLSLRPKNPQPSNTPLQRRDTIDSKEVGTIHTLREMMEVPAYIRKQANIGFPIYKATMNDVEKYNRKVKANSEMNNAIAAL